MCEEERRLKTQDKKTWELLVPDRTDRSELTGNYRIPRSRNIAQKSRSRRNLSKDHDGGSDPKSTSRDRHDQARGREIREWEIVNRRWKLNRSQINKASKDKFSKFSENFNVTFFYNVASEHVITNIFNKANSFQHFNQFLFRHMLCSMESKLVFDSTGVRSNMCLPITTGHQSLLQDSKESESHTFQRGTFQTLLDVKESNIPESKPWTFWKGACLSLLAIKLYYKTFSIVSTSLLSRPRSPLITRDTYVTEAVPIQNKAPNTVSAPMIMTAGNHRTLSMLLQDAPQPMTSGPTWW